MPNETTRLINAPAGGDSDRPTSPLSPKALDALNAKRNQSPGSLVAGNTVSSTGTPGTSTAGPETSSGGPMSDADAASDHFAVNGANKLDAAGLHGGGASEFARGAGKGGTVQQDLTRKPKGLADKDSEADDDGALLLFTDPAKFFGGLYKDVLDAPAWFKNLTRCYGWRLCVMLMLAQWVLKGFMFAYLASSLDFVFRYYQVSGPRIQIYKAVAMIPWSLKPLFGLLSDRVPLFGYHKTSYMVSSNSLQFVEFFQACPGTVAPKTACRNNSFTTKTGALDDRLALGPRIHGRLRNLALRAPKAPTGRR